MDLEERTFFGGCGKGGNGKTLLCASICDIKITLAFFPSVLWFFFLASLVFVVPGARSILPGWLAKRPYDMSCPPVHPSR